MSAASYIAVILIWSTTPLAIKISSKTLSPIGAVSLRMLLAFACALVVAALIRRTSVWQKANLKHYFVASLGIFPNMPLVYWSSQYISSGLIAVIFALSPFFMALFAYFLLDEKVLSLRKTLALMLALFGLSIISIDQLMQNDQALYGIGLMILSNIVYALSSIWLKKLNQFKRVDAFDQTIGAHAFAIPGLLLAWMIYDGMHIPAVDTTTVSAIVYLAVMGSLVGFISFYYILQHMNVGTVALIPMITPALALWFGALIDDELITANIVIGSVLIIVGLILYEGMFKPGIISKIFRKKPVVT